MSRRALPGTVPTDVTDHPDYAGEDPQADNDEECGKCFEDPTTWVADDEED